MNIYLDQEAAAMQVMHSVQGDCAAAVDVLTSRCEMNRVDAVNALLRLGYAVPAYLQALVTNQLPQQ